MNEIKNDDSLNEQVAYLIHTIADSVKIGTIAISSRGMAIVLDCLRKYTRADSRMSKETACRYVGMSRASFDRYVSRGLLPKGRKEAGFKELSWRKEEIDAAIRDITNNRHRQRRKNMDRPQSYEA